MLERSSVEGILAMLGNLAGCHLMGSSANLTGKGTKSVVKGIELGTKAAADIVIHEGWRKYDVVTDLPKIFYGTILPHDLGGEVLFLSHLTRAANAYY